MMSKMTVSHRANLKRVLGTFLASICHVMGKFENGQNGQKLPKMVKMIKLVKTAQKWSKMPNI